MSARQTILKPVGLVTQPNKFGYYVDGALSRAINCVLRNPGELDAAPSMFASSNIGPAGNTLHKLMPLDSGHVYELTVTPGGVWTVTENGNTVILPGGSATFNTTSAFSSTGRINPVRARDRVLFNSSQGYLVGDFMAPTSSAQRALRIASLTQPHIISLGTTTTNAGAIPNTIAVTYSAIMTRTYSDGYILASVPSPLTRLINNSGSTVNATMAVKFGTYGTQYQVGDVIEVYRSDGIVTTNNIQAEPSTTLKLVLSATLTSADVATGFVTLTDAQILGAAPYYQTTGRELYSNPGQGGATTINRQPPIAQATATFDGRVFYGNTTERPKFSFSIPGGVGNSINALQQTAYFRTFGIGGRFGLGTVTLGSAVITGVAANLFLGLKVGQRWSGNGAAWSQQTAIIQSLNSGAGTITMNAVSGANDTVWNFADCIEITMTAGGTGTGTYRFNDYSDLMNALAGNSTNPLTVGPQFEVTASQSFPGTTISTLFTTGATITIEPISHVLGATMAVRATNGANYMPPLAELYTTFPTQPTATTFSRTQLKTRLTWSKDQQGEHVPPSNNETFVGLRELINMKSTRDALWIACLDGIFRLTGIGGQYRLDQIDNTKIIVAPQAMDVLDEDVYVYTNFGILEMNSETRKNLTDMVIGDLLPGPEYLETAARILQANEADLEILYLDNNSSNRLYVFMTKEEGGGWTTLENNPAALSNITALAYQRSPASGDPRVLVGTSPTPGGVLSPNYAGWGNTASFLTMDFQFQPVYANDPMSLKQWIEASYLFDSGNAGKTIRPVWNSSPIGQATVALQGNAAYARAGIPRQHSLAVSIAPGADSITATTPQVRFLGLSLLYEPLTLTTKNR